MLAAKADTMRVTITYIHHNCFVMRGPGRTYLFDYPGDAHLPAGAAERVRRAVAGTDLAVFISHGHDDHMNHDLGSVTSAAAVVRYVLSDDVGELRPEAVPDNGEVLEVEPDLEYALDGMAVATLMSNDLGVAFLVEDRGFRFYYGGDLAAWIWESASPPEAEFTRAFFDRAMERARDFGPHVAFSNTDPRLANLAGGPEACRIIGAPVFVPMHTFGDTASLAGFHAATREAGTRVFHYARSGDSETFSV
jgi:L-ascorbate metabolism protein UlaG (beta-lactamase superfamily)